MSPTPTFNESYNSVFLCMQQKREEQKKSIDAYRSQQCSGYNALLSEVANELHKRITPISIVKDNVEYHDVFSGKEIVNRLSLLLCQTDRKLALSVGKALNSQRFFHDVKYENFLLDDEDHIYQFYSSKEGMDEFKEPDDDDLPNGVYTPLTNCYSSTCTSESMCYSFTCPRKKSLKPSQSQSSLQDKDEHTALWAYSVPKNVVEATLPRERERQECIYELIYTEKDFVRNLQYLQNFWIKPLLNNNNLDNPTEFIHDVFFNIDTIENVNSQLLLALEARQAGDYLVSNIGDIMLQYVSQFDPFVLYGANQVIGKFRFELEKKQNSQFLQFVESTERAPQSRRLELNGYLTKPTTRLGRYNLLLKEILKRTPRDNSDIEVIPQVMEIITRYLVKVNVETGKCENMFNLHQFGLNFSFKNTSDYVDLQLQKDGRQMIMKGRMRRKGSTYSDSSELQVFLLDNYLIFAKIKCLNFVETYKAYRKPIPLELLSFSVTSTNNNKHKRTSTILPYSRPSSIVTGSSILTRPSVSESLSSYKPNNLSITFLHHGRRGSPPITLCTDSNSIQQIWTKKIIDQQALLTEKKRIFTLKPLISKYFASTNRINSTYTIDAISTPYILIGADQGVYISTYDPDTENQEVSYLIPLEKVTQIESLPDSQLLVLADKILWSFSLDSLTPSSLTAQMKRGRSVCQNTSFFHVGECLSKTLVCVVKRNTISDTTIRVLEPIITDEHKKPKSMFSLKRLVRGGSVGLKPYKDLYLPGEATSISLLKTNMITFSSRGIGVVDMKSSGVQALLDPEDENLEFVFSKTDIRPLKMYRTRPSEYLVCYNEFAFFVDQRGRLIKSRPQIYWEGEPDSFALSDTYILAFEPDFIEVRSISTGALEQLIRGKNIKCTSSDRLHFTIDDSENEGFQTLFQLERIFQNKN